MSTFVFILGFLFLSIVAPLWIVFHYLTRWKSMRGLSQEDETMLAELWDSAQRLEDRIGNLEKVIGVRADDRPAGADPHAPIPPHEERH